MVANYFYDLPNELQEKITTTSEELELQEFITYERREAEKRSRLAGSPRNPGNVSS